MRLFGSDRIKGLVTTLGLEEDEPIDAKMLSNAIESAQKKVEARNFETRKHVLQYDEVMNEQRKVIYSQRLQVLRGENMREVVINMIKRVVDDHVASYCVGEIADNWDVKGLSEQMRDIFGLEEDAVSLSKEDLETIDQDDYKERILNLAMDIYKKREEEFGDNMRELERVVMLKVVDQKWMDHLDDMEQLKQGIGLRAYGQKDPVAEYKIEGADMFDAMIENIRNDTVKYVYRARLVQQSLEREQVAKPVATSSDGTVQKQPVHKEHKVGRNDPCPCGSGLKYKKCCGKDE